MQLFDSNGEVQMGLAPDSFTVRGKKVKEEAKSKSEQSEQTPDLGTDSEQKSALICSERTNEVEEKVRRQ